MSKRSIAIKQDSAAGETQTGKWEVVEPQGGTPYASFTYTVTEISSVAGRTRINSRTTRMTDGKLLTEKLDGELDGSAFERLAMQAHAQFASQLRAMMQPFSWLLPSARDRGE